MPRHRKKTFKYTQFVLITLASLVTILFIYVLSHLPFFSINNIQVEGDGKNLITTQIKNDLTGTNILFFDEAKEKSSLLKNSYIKSLTFIRNYPSSLSVKVSYRTPVAIWQGRNGSFLIDRDGLAYQVAQAESLPLMTNSDSEVVLGERVSQDGISSVLGILGNLDQKFTVLTARIRGGDIEFILSGGVRVELSSSSDIVALEQALQLILQKDKIEGKLPRIIDLRYQNPVVTY